MKKQQIDEFDKVIHGIKGLISSIATERTRHHKKLDIERNKHDKKLNQMLKKGTKAIEDIYELYYELSEEKRSGE